MISQQRSSCKPNILSLVLMVITEVYLKLINVYLECLFYLGWVNYLNGFWLVDSKIFVHLKFNII